MPKRLFDYDPETGVAEYWHSDHATGEYAIEIVQDVTPHIEAAKEAAKTDDGFKRGVKASWCHVAVYPLWLQYKWLNEYGVNIYNRDHWPAVRKLLNDPDWRFLKTIPGKV